MRIRNNILTFYFILTFIHFSSYCFGQNHDSIPPRYIVSLPEAHIGNEEIDMKLLDSYELMPENYRQFYLQARAVFSQDSSSDFTNPEILKAARNNKIALLGGPMLGNLSDSGVIIWLRPSSSKPLKIIVKNQDGEKIKSYLIKAIDPGKELRISIEGLSSNTDYKYTIHRRMKKLAESNFTTAPSSEEKGLFRIAFGSCFHKIGLHNPNLINQILKRNPYAIMLLGDIAVDDREDSINMHRSDYLLRDMSQPWKNLSANVPLYTAWDDHDYLNNDLSGIPDRFDEADRDRLRAVWYQNWNNPPYRDGGIYFSSRLGPVEIIMLDTRSCRTVEERGRYGSYLGKEQQEWLKETLKNSSAPYKIISSGTMWSDDISNGKDSWGTWDTLAREEIFSFIETEAIAGVLLISGDRHGARGFSIPRPSGNIFYEFEAASLGGVPGPKAMAKDSTNQLFGYYGSDIKAFGEFTFNTNEGIQGVTFRLIDEYGNILEEHYLSYDELSPK